MTRSPGKWVKARSVAERDELAARYREWDIVGPPEMRDVEPGARYFSPHRPTNQKPVPQVNPHLEQPPAIDNLERFLVSLFLGRYVTYCARWRDYVNMQSAAALYREIVAA